MLGECACVYIVGLDFFTCFFIFFLFIQIIIDLKKSPKRFSEKKMAEFFQI